MEVTLVRYTAQQIQSCNCQIDKSNDNHNPTGMFDNKVYGSRGAYSGLGPHHQFIRCWNFDQARTNSAMTHVLVLSAKARRNEWFK